MEAVDILRNVAEVIDPVYLVGGSVRDAVMGRACTDYDAATPLSPDDVEAAVRRAGRRPYLVGKRFGTIAFKLDGLTIEVTTFRRETYEERSRKPQVEFVTELDADLSRRDFTVNAMALSPSGEVVDPFGGREDIAARIVRAVGNPRERFAEDPLRMLRAARFVSQLDFALDEVTAEAISRSPHRLLDVARERWMLELDKLLLGPGVGAGLRVLAATGQLRYLLPELALQIDYDQNSRYHDRTLWEHTIGVVEATPVDITLRWAALLHDIGKPFVRRERPDRATYVMHDALGAELVERTALYLKWSAKRRQDVTALVANHMAADSPLREADDAAKPAKPEA